MAWYKVIAFTPISINHQNGAVQALPYGVEFEADPGLPDVRKWLKTMPPKLTSIQRPSKVNALPQPGPSFPIPSEQAPAPPKLPAGINDLVKSGDQSKTK